MRAVIYTRISTEDQSEYSLEDQESRARAYATQQAWQIVRVYQDDGGSGQKVTRRAFSQMRQELAQLGVKALIVYDLDRLMRNLREQLNLKHELDRLGIILVSLSDNGVIDTSTPEGQMQFQVKGMVSEFQARTTGRKVRDNLQYKARNGGWVGPVPYGYERSAGELIPSNDAPIVERIFTWYASGNHSYTSIAEDLNAAGSTIIDWQTKTRKPFGRESVRGILHNAAYIGMVSCSGVEYPGRHAPLIARGLWERCAAVQARRTTQDGGRVSIRGTGGLLSEIAACGVCGARMHWHVSGRTGQGYYRCARRAGYGKAACASGMVRALTIENRVRELLRLLIIPAELRDRVLAEVQRRLALPAPVALDAERIRRQIVRLKSAYLSGDEELTEALYFAERNRLIGLLAAQPAPGPRVLDVGCAIDVLSAIGRVVDAGSFVEQRSLVQQVFDVLWIERAGVVAIGAAPAYDALIVTVGSGSLKPVRHPLPTALPPRWSAFQQIMATV